MIVRTPGHGRGQQDKTPGALTSAVISVDMDVLSRAVTADRAAARDVDDSAVQQRHKGGAAEVAAQTLTIAELVARLGGQVLADVAPPRRN